MAQFTKTIQNFASQYDLWQKRAKIIVGVSGGPDSSCLLDVLSRLAKKYDLKLHIAHVNYGLRGGDSKRDELFVRDLGNKYGIPVSVLRPKNSQYKGNMENSLRDIRYGYFEGLRKDLSYDLVAVAHNQDDQAETVLMRFLRGSGLNGLGSMKPKNGKVVRPLLKTSKNEILAYLKEKGLSYRTDKTNKDTDLTRNRIRHKLIPYLEKNFNPSLRKTLGDWSFTVADDYDYIDKKAQGFTKAVCTNKCADFSAEKFLAQPGAIQRQVLRNLAKKINKSLFDIESKQIEEMLKVIKSGKNKTQKAFIAGLKIMKKGDNVSINL